MGLKIGVLFEFEGRVFRLTNAEYTGEQGIALPGKLYAIVAQCLEPAEGEGPWWTIETSLHPLPDIITEH